MPEMVGHTDLLKSTTHNFDRLVALGLRELFQIRHKQLVQ